MVGLKDHMAQFKDAYLSEDHSHMTVNDMWVKFKTSFVEAVERFIPSKMIKTKYSVPWIDAKIKQLVNIARSEQSSHTPGGSHQRL